MVQSDWLGAFWPISQETDISQIRYLHSSMASSMNVPYRTNLEKNNDQIFQQFQKTLFLAHFWAKIFSQNIQLCHALLGMGF